MNVEDIMSATGDKDLIMIEVSSAGILTVWIEDDMTAERNAVATLSYYEVDREASETYATVRYLGVDSNGSEVIPRAGVRSGFRWIGDDNGILSVELTNTDISYYILVDILHAGSYDIGINFMPVGQLDDDDDGFANHGDNCPLVKNPAQRDDDEDGRGYACDPDNPEFAVGAVQVMTTDLNGLEVSWAAPRNSRRLAYYMVSLCEVGGSCLAKNRVEGGETRALYSAASLSTGVIYRARVQAVHTYPGVVADEYALSPLSDMAAIIRPQGLPVDEVIEPKSRRDDITIGWSRPADPAGVVLPLVYEGSVLYGLGNYTVFLCDTADTCQALETVAADSAAEEVVRTYSYHFMKTKFPALRRGKEYYFRLVAHYRAAAREVSTAVRTSARFIFYPVAEAVDGGSLALSAAAVVGRYDVNWTEVPSVTEVTRRYGYVAEYRVRLCRGVDCYPIASTSNTSVTDVDLAGVSTLLAVAGGAYNLTLDVDYGVPGELLSISRVIHCFVDIGCYGESDVFDPAFIGSFAVGAVQVMTTELNELEVSWAAPRNSRRLAYYMVSLCEVGGGCLAADRVEGAETRALYSAANLSRGVIYRAKVRAVHTYPGAVADDYAVSPLSETAALIWPLAVPVGGVVEPESQRDNITIGWSRPADPTGIVLPLVYAGSVLYGLGEYRVFLCDTADTCYALETVAADSAAVKVVRTYSYHFMVAKFPDFRRGKEYYFRLVAHYRAAAREVSTAVRTSARFIFYPVAEAVDGDGLALSAAAVADRYDVSWSGVPSVTAITRQYGYTAEYGVRLCQGVDCRLLALTPDTSVRDLDLVGNAVALSAAGGTYNLTLSVDYAVTADQLNISRVIHCFVDIGCYEENALFDLVSIGSFAVGAVRVMTTDLNGLEVSWAAPRNSRRLAYYMVSLCEVGGGCLAADRVEGGETRALYSAANLSTGVIYRARVQAVHTYPGAVADEYALSPLSDTAAIIRPQGLPVDEVVEPKSRRDDITIGWSRPADPAGVVLPLVYEDSVLYGLGNYTVFLCDTADTCQALETMAADSAAEEVVRTYSYHFMGTKFPALRRGKEYYFRLVAHYRAAAREVSTAVRTSARFIFYPVAEAVDGGSLALSAAAVAGRYDVNWTGVPSVTEVTRRYGYVAEYRVRLCRGVDCYPIASTSNTSVTDVDLAGVSTLLAVAGGAYNLTLDVDYGVPGELLSISRVIHCFVDIGCYGGSDVFDPAFIGSFAVGAVQVMTTELNELEVSWAAPRNSRRLAYYMVSLCEVGGGCLAADRVEGAETRALYSAANLSRGVLYRARVRAVHTYPGAVADDYAVSPLSETAALIWPLAVPVGGVVEPESQRDNITIGWSRPADPTGIVLPLVYAGSVLYGLGEYRVFLCDTADTCYALETVAADSAAVKVVRTYSYHFMVAKFPDFRRGKEYYFRLVAHYRAAAREVSTAVRTSARFIFYPVAEAVDENSIRIIDISSSNLFNISYSAVRSVTAITQKHGYDAVYRVRVCKVQDDTKCVNLSPLSNHIDLMNFDLALQPGAYCTITVIVNYPATGEMQKATSENPFFCLVDKDYDGVVDVTDVDDDGDGLIELTTAEMLHNSRYVLDGSGYSSDGIDLSMEGCGGLGGVTRCHGYELIQNISLVAYSNWQPIGEVGEKFNSTFDGNNYTISGLTIDRGDSDGVGLFGYVAAGVVLRNLRIMSAHIVGKNRVGILVGDGEGISIISSYVQGSNLSGAIDNVGGLVGQGSHAVIELSYAQVDNLSGYGAVGGLVGLGNAIIINSSYARIGSVGGNDHVGGLLGSGRSAYIGGSYAQVGTVSARSHVGGLVGYGNNATIFSSFAQVNDLNGYNYIGGLVGDGFGARIVLSYAQVGTVNASKFAVGGLVGYGDGAKIASSYAQVRGISGGDTVGGLVGYGYLIEIISSYVHVGHVHGNRGGVGGLVGSVDNAILISSYTWTGDLRGADPGGLVGRGNGVIINASFWGSVSRIEDNSGVMESTAAALTALGSAELELQSKDLTRWCDIDGDGRIEDAERVGSMWDFGTSSDYPALRCTLGGVEVQRAWLMMNEDIFHDRDQDRVVDHTDNCIDRVNSDQLDSDRDGLGDACDDNDDNDGFTDDLDIDDDGDGLIELKTAEMLHNSRYVLNGSGYSNDGVDLSVVGCGGLGGVTRCHGYELVRDISLVAYSNWQPIGGVGEKFNSTFDGNDYTISRLTIGRGDSDGVGLFGYVEAGVVLRNLRVVSAHVVGKNRVGVLVGDGEGVSIISSYVRDAHLSGYNYIGGLAGGGSGARIVLSYAQAGTVNGRGHAVGGLVGHGSNATILSSFAQVDDLRGSAFVGGLVGDGFGARIVLSYAQVGTVSASGFAIGGLVGYGYLVKILSSYTQVRGVSGGDAVGGLVGMGKAAEIVASYVQVGDLSGINTVSGLVGYAESATINSSYVWIGNLRGADPGGLIGRGDGVIIDASFWGSVSRIEDNSGVIESTVAALTALGSAELELQSKDLTRWCDIDGDGRIEDAERVGSMWDFGTSNDYPALRCTLRGVEVQRAWLMINKDIFRDRDQDRVVDHSDNCIDRVNSDQLNSDRDGLGDACDDNDDNDGFADDLDIDDDGDGLIELTTAEMLHNSRYVLNGSGYSNDGVDLSMVGCGGLGGVTRCHGYELVRDISLVAYSNWQPIGGVGEKFNSTFDGNNYTISGLTIDRGDSDGVGLFGYVAAGVVLRNLRVVSAHVVGKNRVGILVGNGEGASIVSSYVQNGNLRGDRFVGGLVGFGRSATIVSSYIQGGNLSGDSHIGGLAGGGWGASIVSSYVQDGNLSGDRLVGGLVGFGRLATIVSSYVQDSNLSGNVQVGGLLGNGRLASITSSYVQAANLGGTNHSIGGLAGNGRRATITSSYFRDGALHGNNRVGGLVGSGSMTSIVSSYVQADNLSGISGLGGLVGYDESSSSIISSYFQSNGAMSGNDTVGGLVGYGRGTSIISSYVQAAEVSGVFDSVGGLMGDGREISIVSSYAQVGRIEGTESIGGFVGYGAQGSIISSYVQAGSIEGLSNIGGLVGYENMVGSSSTFWNSVVPIAGGPGLGVELTAMELRTLDLDDMEIAPNHQTQWCDRDGNQIIETAEQIEANRVWDLGSDDDYLALRCTLGGTSMQRRWLEAHKDTIGIE